jgi:hypothetical protein
LCLAFNVGHIKTQQIVNLQFDFVQEEQLIEEPMIIDIGGLQSDDEPQFNNEFTPDIEYANIEISSYDIIQHSPIVQSDTPKSAEPTGQPAKSSLSKGGGSGSSGKSKVKEFNKRLSKYNGKKGDIQVSVIWDNINDIDVQVLVYNENDYAISKIDWTSKRDNYGGVLDIDMNSVYSARSENPIENIFWNKRAPKGKYFIYINHFKCYDIRYARTPVKIMIKHQDGVKVIDTVSEWGQPPKLIDKFNN